MGTITKQDLRDLYVIPPATNVKKHKGCGVEIISYESKNKKNESKFFTLTWWGKQTKPSKHYMWNDVLKSEKYIQETLLKAELWDTDKKVNAKRKKLAKHPYKVGDILHGSWGYDQTQCDYFQVVKVVGKSIKIREICSEVTEYTQSMACNQIAVKDSFVNEKVFRKIPQCYITQRSEPSWYVKSPIFGSLSMWDGSPKYRSWYG